MNKKIKILFAINNLNLGGAEVVVSEQIKHLDKEKFTVYLANLYRSKQPNLISQVNCLGPDRFKQFNFSSKSVLSFKKWREIYKFLRQEKFAVIYTHLFESNMIYRLLGFILRVPVIISFEHSQYFNKSGWQKLVDWILAALTDKIIVATKAVADFTASQEKINQDKFAVIANPVSLPDRNKLNLAGMRQELNIAAGDFVVLTLGRFSEEKGPEYILELAKKLKNNIANLKVLLIGYGPLEEDLREIIARDGLGNFCQLVVKPEQAKEYLFLGDVFVLTSTREGQSIATYEAMAAGLPVAAFTVGGVKDIVRHGDNGWLFPVGDTEGMAEKISYLYNNSERRLTMAEQAKTDVKSYGPENNIKLFEQLVFSLLNNKFAR